MSDKNAVGKPRCEDAKIFGRHCSFGVLFWAPFPTCVFTLFIEQVIYMPDKPEINLKS